MEWKSDAAMRVSIAVTGTQDGSSVLVARTMRTCPLVLAISAAAVRMVASKTRDNCWRRASC